MTGTDKFDGLAFIFPGQGSQTVGMLDEFLTDPATEFSLIRETFAEASAALGYDLQALVSEGPEDQLNQTEFTQPAILATSVALWRVWRELDGPFPARFAGHSLGEYSALVCAGSLSLGDAVGLVRDRGRLMQQAVPAGEGAMAAILGLSDEQVEACCAAVAGDVAAANYNAPGQIVIAGKKSAVDAAIIACKEAGAKRALAVAMSVPSHSSLLAGAAEQLGERLAQVEVNQPEGLVIHNVDARPASSVEEIRSKLVEQLYNPVRWTACSSQLSADGVTTMVECGPGKQLSGMQKRIEKSCVTYALGSVAGLRSALEALT